MNIEGEHLKGKIGEDQGVLVLSINGNGSGIRSATFYAPDTNEPRHIRKIVHETEKIYGYEDLIAAVARAGFVTIS